MGLAHISKCQMISVSVFVLICFTAIGLSIGLTLPNVKRKEPSSSRLGIYARAAVGTDGIPCSTIGKYPEILHRQGEIVIKSIGNLGVSSSVGNVCLAWGHTSGAIGMKAGRDILKAGGNAVDAAVSATLCIGIANTHSAGIGGGMLATVWNATERRAYAIDARESAPAAATADMFKGSSSLSQKGGLASGVPGELKGLWEMHSRMGRLPWRTLVEPIAALARNGTRVSFHLANALREKKQEILNEPTMSVFVNPATGSVWVEGDIIRRPKLAETLDKIAEYGADALYNGVLTEGFVNDVQKKGGIITVADMNNYTALFRPPVAIEMYGNMSLYSSPLPGSGVLLAYIVNILDEFHLSAALSKASLDDQTLALHRMVESFKFAYAQRTRLGDTDFEPDVLELVRRLSSEEFANETRRNISDSQTFNDPAYYGAEVYNPENHGTSHLSIVDEEGNAVALTTTVNLYFGAGYISESTGIILNDEMDDFSAPNITNAFGIPPSPTNFIKPGKRPLSSMVPTIVVMDDEVRLVIGAAGGTKITSGTAYALMRNLWFGDDIKAAIDARRLHHQIFPMILQHEADFQPYFAEELKKFGHNVTEFEGWGSVVVGISRENGMLYANSDFRKGGEVDGY